MSDLPLYKCHKQVRAVHIAGVEIHKDGSATIAPREQGIEPFKTDAGWGERFKGSEGDPGVYVEYDDGYASWSPTDKFDAGYSLIKE